MTSPQPEAPVATEERIGEYRVHPVASMFPLLEGKEYGDLLLSIMSVGQIHPIIVKDGVLLDGRNRLKVCLELYIEPRVEEYTGPLDPADYIKSANLDRRNLSDDQRIAIGAKIHFWRVEQRNAERQRSGKSADGEAGGRGRKKTLPPNDGKVSRDRHARSTAGQLAAEYDVSERRAAQTVAVARAAPELLDQVVTGAMLVKDAVAKVAKPKTKRPPPTKATERREGKMVNHLAGRIWSDLAKDPAVRQRRVFTLLVQRLLQRLNPDDRRRFYHNLVWPDICYSPEEFGEYGLAQLDRKIHDFQQLKIDATETFLTDLQAELTRRCGEIGAWIQGELEAFEREHSAGKTG